MKHFTIDEAEALIPELERVFAAVAELVAQAEGKASVLRRRERDGDSDAAATEIERAQLRFLARGVDEWLGKIAALGGVPKGIDPGLVDFPHRLEGREIYLCWRLGEKRITHYHGVDEGFSGRKPLPKRRVS